MNPINSGRSKMRKKKKKTKGRKILTEALQVYNTTTSPTATTTATTIGAITRAATTQTTMKKKTNKMKGQKILTRAVEKLLEQEKGNLNYGTPYNMDDPNELIEDICDIDLCHYQHNRKRKYILPIAIELELEEEEKEGSIDTTKSNRYQNEIISAGNINDHINNTRGNDDDILVSKKVRISTGSDEDNNGKNDGIDVDGDKDIDVPAMKKIRIYDNDGNDDDKANHSDDCNGNEQIEQN
jgi:hypothetical protein